ncbi:MULTISPECIES: hypothetical protein [unclassified Streptomyces]|uniref:hypothetical protein n=1 Tax=unclassified Streptomyces TaxID=2593676 RepID=UPI002E28B316|nr:hypothetical protein [Streptomyces sp. NBC_00223]
MQNSDLMNDAGLELALQELETLEAPGFWSGVVAGFEATAAVVAVAVGSAAVYTAVASVIVAT